MRTLLIAVLLLIPVALSSPRAEALRGREIFLANCAGCHSLDPDEIGKRGPHLAGLFERRYGAVEGFPYRMVWTEADPHWTEAHLDAYLEIHRLPEPVSRSEVIAFLAMATAGAPLADPARGEALYNTQCSYCHALTPEGARTLRRVDGRTEDIPRAVTPPPLEPAEPTRAGPEIVESLRRGPHFAGLFDRAPGGVAGFPYRFVYEISGTRWTEADLDSYIALHARLESLDRADLIAFLKSATP